MICQCILCNSRQLEIVGGTKKEVFVTGNREKFDIGDRIIEKAICKKCGLLQYIQTEDYKKTIDEVFKNYEVMHNKTFSADSNQYEPRLYKLSKKVSTALRLKDKGKILDIGCGGGEFLQWFGQINSGWELYGQDIGMQFSKILNTQRTRVNYYSSMEKVRQSNIKFDLVTINSTFSLAYNPVEILRTVHDILSEDGIFFIMDIDIEIHPYLFYCLEMRTFFTQNFLKSILGYFGFEIVNTDYEREKKEIGIFVKKGGNLQELQTNWYEYNRNMYQKSIHYLDNVIDVAIENIEKYQYIGIFGMALAGVWLAEIITEKILSQQKKKIFFIDEDEDILQKKEGANGYPIYRLEEITQNAIVFLPFPRYIADGIEKRCSEKYKNIKFIKFDL